MLQLLLKDCPDLWDDFLADFLAGLGAGAAIIFFTTSSNFTPWSLKSFAFAILKLKHKPATVQPFFQDNRDLTVFARF